MPPAASRRTGRLTQNYGCAPFALTVRFTDERRPAPHGTPAPLFGRNRTVTHYEYGHPAAFVAWALRTYGIAFASAVALIAGAAFLLERNRRKGRPRSAAPVLMLLAGAGIIVAILASAFVTLVNIGCAEPRFYLLIA